MNERIKDLRKIVGLSQKEFGERIGVSDTAISKIQCELCLFKRRVGRYV